MAFLLHILYHYLQISVKKKKPNSECDNEIDRSSFIKSLLPEKSFSLSSIPAPLDPAVQQVLPGKVLIPAVIDQVQGQALAALQVLKVVLSLLSS